MILRYSCVVFSAVLFISGCRKDPVRPVLKPEAYNLIIPQGFPQMAVPADNEFTPAGVELGKKLFYDVRLSGDNSQACASCHMVAYSFSDTSALSKGIDGLDGKRNSMPVFNVGWSPELFWDGRSPSLENQALFPVIDELEMHEEWPNVVTKLYADAEYPQMFEDAFGSPGIDSVRAAKAMAQFMRTLISGDSPFDRYLNTLNPAELGQDFPDIIAGYNLFKDPNKGDCIHCHTDPVSSRLTTDFSYRSNGLAMTLQDSGRAKVTGLASDYGLFKVPSVRNLVFTAPYMHDGRFETLDEVLDFYINDVQPFQNVDPVMYQTDTAGGGSLGAQLSPVEKNQLKKFLLSLTDSTFITNPDFQE